MPFPPAARSSDAGSFGTYAPPLTATPREARRAPRGGDVDAAAPPPPLPGWVVKLLAVAVTVGVAWGTTQLTISTMRLQLDRIDARVGEMYCGSLPVEKRPGCR